MNKNFIDCEQQDFLNIYQYVADKSVNEIADIVKTAIAEAAVRSVDELINNTKEHITAITEVYGGVTKDLEKRFIDDPETFQKTVLASLLQEDFSDYLGEIICEKVEECYSLLFIPNLEQSNN